MALMMVAQGISPEDVLDPQKDVAFPASVVEMLRGDLGQPPGGWPTALQAKALKGALPMTARPGSLLQAADLGAERKAVEVQLGRPIDDEELASALMYPKVSWTSPAPQANTDRSRRCRRRSIFTKWRSATRRRSKSSAARRWSSAFRRSAKPTRRATSRSSSSSMVNRAW
jgi:hypothetical protein